MNRIFFFFKIIIIIIIIIIIEFSSNKPHLLGKVPGELGLHLEFFLNKPHLLGKVPGELGLHLLRPPIYLRLVPYISQAAL